MLFQQGCLQDSFLRKLGERDGVAVYQFKTVRRSMDEYALEFVRLRKFALYMIVDKTVYSHHF